uniref:Uncharacterized protein n=1 Tax=Arundo donax TaxID=35708 RepID=A0A0A8XTL4_ARUDO
MVSRSLLWWGCVILSPPSVAKSLAFKQISFKRFIIKI